MVVMLNCPQWGLSIQSIRIKGATSVSSEKELLSITNLDPDLFSCESLLNVCLLHTVSSVYTVVTLQFDHMPDSSWVHLAEVSFFAEGAHCPPDSFITSATTSTTTHRGKHIIVLCVRP